MEESEVFKIKGNDAESIKRRLYIQSKINVKLELYFKAWKDWFDSAAPEETDIPDSYNTKLDTFHKLLLIRSWCPDRTVPMAKIYVREIMGKQVCTLKLLNSCWDLCPLADLFVSGKLSLSLQLFCLRKFEMQMHPQFTPLAHL